MTHLLTIEPLGATIEVAEGQTLLDAALRQGIYLPHACGHGLCGSCKVQLCEGEVDHGAANPFALMDVEREEGKTLACCATLLGDATIEADIDDEPDAQIIPVRDVAATVAGIEALTPTVKALRLRLGAPLHFQAGQYVQLEIPGLGQSRAFSIADSPAEVERSGCITLQVRRVPGGAGTGWVHERLKAGDAVRLAGPYGRFFVRRSAPEPLLLLAGGSGLSSPRAMLRDLLDAGDTRPITLLVGQRSRDELYGHDELLQWAADHPSLRYLPVLSHEPEGSAWDGARGFVHEAAKALYGGQFNGLKAYLCGPPPMVEACIATLMQGRLFERDIYTEKFLSAADAAQARSPLFKRL